VVAISEKEKKELTKEIMLVLKQMSYDFDNDLSTINYLKRLSKEYQEENVAKACFNVDGIYLIMPLAISGNKKTEKYLKLLLEINKEDGDAIFDCAIGLIALDIDEGFEIIEQFIYKTHPFYDGSDMYDVSNYLKYVNTPRAIKMKLDIKKGKYYSFFQSSKNKVFIILKSEGYNIEFLENNIFDYINMSNQDEKFIIHPVYNGSTGVMIVGKMLDILDLLKSNNSPFKLILFIEDANITHENIIEALQNKEYFYSRGAYGNISKILKDESKLIEYLNKVIIIRNSKVSRLEYP